MVPHSQLPKRSWIAAPTGLSVALAAAALAASTLAPAAALAQDRGPAQQPAPATQEKGWQAIDIPELEPFSPPVPERVELPNGAVLFLLQDDELPLIDLSVTFRGGSYLEPRDKAGLASITAEVMRTGGTERHPGDDLNERLEGIAASIEVGIGLTEASISLDCLKESFDELLPILVDVAMNPRFPQDKLDLARQQHLSVISRRNDDPSGIARREFSRALYGDSSPYGWTEEPATVRSITREDLAAFHQRLFRADRAVIGVVGDFDPARMKAQLEQALSALPRAEEALPEPPQPESAAGSGVYVIDRPELTQSTIRMGHLTFRRTPDHKDYFALVVMNDILGGGGFSSRLLQIVRTEKGLAYGVGSGYSAPYTHPGTFTIGCQTKCETTFEAIAAIRDEVARVVSTPPSTDELEVAKDSMLQELIFSNESRGEIVARAMRYELHDFPQDYLERFQAGIAAVTAEDVLRVAKEYVRPDAMLYTIVANKALLDGDPASLGEVTEVDVDEPAWQPEGSGAEAGEAGADAHSAEAREAGLALAREVVAAAGGEEALAAVESVAIRGSGQATTPGAVLPVQVDSLMVYPDRVKSTLVLPFGVVVQCYDGTAGWVKTPQGVADLPASQAKQLRAEIEKDELAVLRRLLEPGSEPALLGEVEADGGKALVLDAGSGLKLYVDPETKRIIRRDQETPQGTMTTRYADFRPVGGVVIPFSVKKSAEGRPVIDMTIEAVEINPDVPEDAFARPAG